MYRPHHPDRRPTAEHVTTPAALAGPAAVRAAEDSFDRSDAVYYSRDDLRLCSAEPLRLVVLMHWRFRMKDGLPCAPEDICASLTEQGILDADGTSPVRLEDVARALAFLDGHGALGGGASA
ncbi:hypothetical protein [Streptomyces californicus]|uniref:hypothetical protein n=1 Tax=Streptomyces californicus TaxID=67351 RepID=UPI0033FC8C29